MTNVVCNMVGCKYNEDMFCLCDNIKEDKWVGCMTFKIIKPKHDGRHDD